MTSLEYYKTSSGNTTLGGFDRDGGWGGTLEVRGGVSTEVGVREGGEGEEGGKGIGSSALKPFVLKFFPQYKSSDWEV